jgi:hypothetical protein
VAPHDPPSIFSHKGTQRVKKKNKPPQNDPNKKFLEVQKPFYKKVFGRRSHYFPVALGESSATFNSRRQEALRRLVAGFLRASH